MFEVQDGEYKSIEKALDHCKKTHGPLWGLPNGKSDLKKLLLYMKIVNVETVYLSLRREKLNSWQWVESAKKCKFLLGLYQFLKSTV